MFKLPHNCTHLTRQHINAQNSPNQASTVHELRTSRYSSWIQKRQRNRDQIANICWIIEKAREFQENIYFCFIDYAKAFDCVDHNKLWKILQEMRIHFTCLLRNLYVGQEGTVRTGHETTDWFQIEKELHQGCLSSLCLFNFYAENIMGNARLDEAQTEIKIAQRSINNLRYGDNITCHFMANRWGNNGNSDRLNFLGLQNHWQMVTAAMKLKDTCSLEEKL